MAAGDTWVEVKQLLAQLSGQDFDTPANSWSYVEKIVTDAQTTFNGLERQVEDSGLQSGVTAPLRERTGGIRQAFSAAAAGLRDLEPSFMLHWLGGIPSSLLDQMNQDERGRYDQPRWPNLLSADPDMRLLQDITLGWFDDHAGDYLGRLKGYIEDTTKSFQQLNLDWPFLLPQADPSVDPTAIGG